MNIFILADISDVLQSPHPVFGIPLGVGLFVLILYKLFTSNQVPPSPPKNNFQSFPPPNIPPKEIQSKDEETLKWLRIAAEHNDPEAQSKLGFRYMSGNGVPQNKVETYKWLFLSVAQKGGPTDSTPLTIEFFRGCERGMTPEEVAEARRLVSEFKSK
jgi:hypothetical protein